MRLSRRHASLIAVVSLIVTVFSCVVFARDIGEFNRSMERTTYAFYAVESSEFSCGGRPVTIEETTDAGGHPHLRISYGDSLLDLRATILGNELLPGLEKHKDWFRVIRFAEAVDTTLAELRARVDRGEVTDRVAVVTRVPEPGVESHDLALMRHKAMQYVFYEFMPNGTFGKETLLFPHSKRHEDAAEDELKPGTWQYQAAILFVPPGSGLKHKFQSTGMRSGGWALPAAGVGFAVFAFALGFAVAPRRGAPVEVQP